MSTLTIRCRITGRTVTCERHDIAEALAPWFIAAPDDVLAAVAQLEDAVLRGERTDELLAFLALSIEVESVQ